MRKNQTNIIQKIMELIYRSTITGLLSDTFGAKTEHKRDGNILIFDRQVIEKLSKTDKYKDYSQRDMIIEVKVVVMMTIIMITRRIQE